MLLFAALVGAIDLDCSSRYAGDAYVLITVADCSFTDLVTAEPSARGGAISLAEYGELRIVNTTFARCRLTGDSSIGGALYVEESELSINGSCGIDCAAAFAGFCHFVGSYFYPRFTNSNFAQCSAAEFAAVWATRFMGGHLNFSSCASAGAGDDAAIFFDAAGAAMIAYTIALRCSAPYVFREDAGSPYLQYAAFLSNVPGVAVVFAGGDLYLIDVYFMFSEGGADKLFACSESGQITIWGNLSLSGSVLPTFSFDKTANAVVTGAVAIPWADEIATDRVCPQRTLTSAFSGSNLFQVGTGGFARSSSFQVASRHFTAARGRVGTSQLLRLGIFAIALWG